MKPQSIGIVGGAGPLAGSFLLERILSLSRSTYGCYKDADFPKIFLLSFPFSEMLSSDMDIPTLRQELSGCLAQLRQNGAAILAIACNTLHAFLDERDDLTNLVHLPQAIGSEIPPNEVPLVFCTTTSVNFALHQRFFPCVYPDSDTQLQIDRIIDQILRGSEQEKIAQTLCQLLAIQTQNTIILGCTELSIFTKYLSPCKKLIIDPLEIMAQIILEKSFSKEVLK